FFCLCSGFPLVLRPFLHDALPIFSDSKLEWAQEHMAILSGLYGVLRPLDLMQPYRLEMGTRLVTDRGKTLYDYWGTQIADYLNTDRKSTRLNSSHVKISYAVFCLK